MIAGPTFGSLTVNSDGSFDYVANTGFSGTDTFTYSAKDNTGLVTNTVTVTITVRPVAVNDSYATTTNTALTKSAATGILANDRGATLTKNAIVAGPSFGTITLNNDGSFNYVPNTGFSGTDTFTYTAKDTATQVTNTATVTIVVNPVAVADSYTVDAGTTLSKNAATGILANDLGVTLLSSDMGKLYVALAQAIERLRK